MIIPKCFCVLDVSKFEYVRGMEHIYKNSTEVDNKEIYYMYEIKKEKNVYTKFANSDENITTYVNNKFLKYFKDEWYYKTKNSLSPIFIFDKNKKLTGLALPDKSVIERSIIHD